ncbi:MAG: hypothetical protein GF418_06865 [Chitinivibrionales bacterium]|nr:hypothetical protein [Chitinivibrionales bacterium]MBD3395331.1 hypothetical protein [Chitinivibrionales bacterium]
MVPVRLAVDVESGDFGSRTLLRGVLDARQRSHIPFSAVLCGNRAAIESELDALSGRGPGGDGLTVEHCPQTIDAGDAPARVWKTKKQSPSVRCISLQKERAVDASVSAGDTGILMGASVFLLGRDDNVARPALAAFLPTTGERPSLMLDVGANLDCRADHLVAFAYMGFDYVKRHLGIACPRVALLNIGHEPSKGTRTLGEAGERLAGACEGYCGFVEGGRVLSGDVDVVVCDGFTGNVLLKACESFHSLMESVLAKHKRLVRAVKKRMTILNPENYGAVPLLGIRGIVFKAHGSSSTEAFANALLAAVAAVHRRLPVLQTA